MAYFSFIFTSFSYFLVAFSSSVFFLFLVFSFILLSAPQFMLAYISQILFGFWFYPDFVCVVHLSCEYLSSVNSVVSFLQWGVRWHSWLRHCTTSRKVAGSILNGVTGFFSLTQSFRPHYGPGVDSASNRNEYEVCFLGVKAVSA